MSNHPIGVQAAVADSQTWFQAGHLSGRDGMAHNRRIRVQAEGMVLQSGLKADLGAPAALVAHLAGRPKKSLSIGCRYLFDETRIVTAGFTFDERIIGDHIGGIAGTGAVQEPLVVAPAMSVSLGLPGGALPLTAKSLALTATVHSNVKGAANG